VSSTDTSLPAIPAAAALVARRALPAQFVRFALVGASGYLLNLAVFVVVVHGLDAHYRIGALAGFVVAVSSNFLGNRHWTFAGHGGRHSHQAARFLVVSVAAFALGLAGLSALVDAAGLPSVLAQAIATIAVTPVSFAANRLWTFRAR
jgi:putative flippase GtrA